MGAIEDAVAAIYANNALTLTQKRQQAAQQRANGINTLLTGHLPFTWTSGVWVVTITAASVVASTFGWALSVTASVTKGDVAQTINNPMIFVNPPVLVDDPAGTIVRTGSNALSGAYTRTLREDPATALRTIVLAELVRQVGP